MSHLNAPASPAGQSLVLIAEDEAEIADILGISQTNVSTRISRLKQRIRNEL